MGTRLGIKAEVVFILNEARVPFNNARNSKIKRRPSIASSITIRANATLCSIFNVKPTRRMVTRSKRSAINPTIGLVNKRGIMAAKVTSPTQSAAPVIS